MTDFVQACRDSDSPRPSWLGGVLETLEAQTVATGPERGVWSRRRITRYRLRLAGGEKTVWVFSAGYSEGYTFDVCATEAEARRAFALAQGASA